MYLLDTDVLSQFRRQKPHPQVVRWLADVDDGDLHMSAMTVFEIQMGIERVHASDAAHAGRIAGWLDELIASGTPYVLPVDAAVARLHARMAATPRLRNFITGDPRSRKLKLGADLAIAATAIVHGLVVVSRNVGDFLAIHAGFPLPGLLDPFAGETPIVPNTSAAG